MRSWGFVFLLVALTAPLTLAFAPPHKGLANKQSAVGSPRSIDSTELFSGSSDDDKKKKRGGVDEALRNKLLAETIAPWRTVRLFFYGALGSGAAVGGFITLTGTLAALSGARTDVDLNTEVSARSKRTPLLMEDFPENAGTRLLLRLVVNDLSDNTANCFVRSPAFNPLLTHVLLYHLTHQNIHERS
jgi:hypothetical protein